MTRLGERCQPPTIALHPDKQVGQGRRGFQPVTLPCVAHRAGLRGALAALNARQGDESILPSADWNVFPPARRIRHARTAAPNGATCEESGIVAATDYSAENRVFA